MVPSSAECTLKMLYSVFLCVRVQQSNRWQSKLCRFRCWQLEFCNVNCVKGIQELSSLSPHLCLLMNLFFYLLTVRDTFAPQGLLCATFGHCASHVAESHGHSGAHVCHSVRYAGYAATASHVHTPAHSCRGAAIESLCSPAARKGEDDARATEQPHSDKHHQQAGALYQCGANEATALLYTPEVSLPGGECNERQNWWIFLFSSVQVPDLTLGSPLTAHGHTFIDLKAYGLRHGGGTCQGAAGGAQWAGDGHADARGAALQCQAGESQQDLVVAKRPGRGMLQEWWQWQLSAPSVEAAAGALATLAAVSKISAVKPRELKELPGETNTHTHTLLY